MKRALFLGDLHSLHRVGLCHPFYQTMFQTADKFAAIRAECWNWFAKHIERGQSPERTAEVLVHEVMHALWATFDIGDEGEEETVIKRMAAGLADVARENPVFVDILLKR